MGLVQSYSWYVRKALSYCCMYETESPSGLVRADCWISSPKLAAQWAKQEILYCLHIVRGCSSREPYFKSRCFQEQFPILSLFLYLILNCLYISLLLPLCYQLCIAVTKCLSRNARNDIYWSLVWRNGPSLWKKCGRIHGTKSQRLRLLIPEGLRGRVRIGRETWL